MSERAEMRALVEEWQKSGMSISSFSRENVSVITRCFTGVTNLPALKRRKRPAVSGIFQ